MTRKKIERSSTQLPPSTDVVWAARNWYLYKYLERLGAAHIDRIGISQATKKLVEDLPCKRMPSIPPRVEDDAGPRLETALYPYTRDVQLANQSIGYGENNVDVIWKRKGRTALERVERLSRRTISGRQPEAPPEGAEQTAESAPTKPEPDADPGRTHRASDIREINAQEAAKKREPKPAKAAKVSVKQKPKKTAKK